MKRAVALMLFAVLIAAPSAFADAVVTNGNDSGAGSLRDAVATGGAITFASGVSSVRIVSPITVSAHVDIVGPADYASVGEDHGFFDASVLDFASGSSGSTVTRLLIGENDDHAGIRIESGVSGIQVTNTPMVFVSPPIDLLGTGAAKPTSVFAGPRQADGTVPVTGMVSAPGTVDLYETSLGRYYIGAPRFSWHDSLTLPAAGRFKFILPRDHAAQLVYVTLTNAAGTSEWVASDGDIDPPALFWQPPPNTLNNRELVVTPSEPLAPASVAPGDFSLTMGGMPRTITQARYDQRLNVVHLVSSRPWKPGQAGTIALARPGAISDLAGNPSTDTYPIPVAGLPAGFRTPALGRVSLKRGRHAGVTIRFTTNEPGLALFQVYGKRHRLAGSFVKKVSRAGTQRIGWSGRLKRKQLRAGRYSLTVSMTDSLGNITELARHGTFRVLRKSR